MTQFKCTNRLAFAHNSLNTSDNMWQLLCSPWSVGGVPRWSTCANCFPFDFSNSENIGWLQEFFSPKGFWSLCHSILAVADKVIFMAFSGIVTKSSCFNVSELTVCFTLGIYMFRGSEKNKMKDPFSFPPTRNRVAKKQWQDVYSVFLLFHQIWNLREIMATCWASLSIYLLT